MRGAEGGAAARCVIGIDFGTQSARALVADAHTGRALGEATLAYAHGVIERALPDGTPLAGADWALQCPRDYWDALLSCVPRALENAGVGGEEVIALALSPTACTLLLVDARLRPLCEEAAFASHPHAYAKLWKHHRAQAYADRMTAVARDMNAPWLALYGGKISGEWALPKMLEVYEQDPAVYAQTDRFMEFSDWLIARLTGNADARGAGIAAFKALWNAETGYPDETYLARVHPALPQMVRQKLRGTHGKPGARAGALLPEAARALGLLPGIAVAYAHTDAHCAAYGVGVLDEGDCMMVLGTSLVTHFISREKAFVPGVGAQLPDGLLPGFTCYTAGQACAGDMLEWFVTHALPGDALQSARALGEGAHAYLTRLAARQKPGECGLLALDWWGGNRSPLVNAGLSGALVGLTMETRPEDIYRALLEGIALDQRLMREQYLSRGLHVKRTVVCGGMAMKNRLLLQIIADALNAELQVSTAAQASALGAAMCASAAAGEQAGGYDTLPAAIAGMRGAVGETVVPDGENARLYDALYRRYRLMYDFFGREHPEIMESLRR